MAATQLHRAMARPDPMLNFKWEVLAIPVPNHSNIDTSYIESFEIPFNNVTSSGVFFGGGHNYFPEFHDVSAFNVVFYGDSEGRALAYLWDWKQSVKSFDTGLYKLPTEFKRDWTVNLLNTKGEKIIQVVMQGCWPADTSNITLDQEGSSRITFSQNFSVDNMIIHNKMWPNAGK